MCQQDQKKSCTQTEITAELLDCKMLDAFLNSVNLTWYAKMKEELKLYCSSKSKVSQNNQKSNPTVTPTLCGASYQ
jgi:hypothetical protein